MAPRRAGEERPIVAQSARNRFPGVVTRIERDGIVHIFGSGHSQLAALDVNGRAGCIAPLQVIFDPTWGRAELVEGYGETLLCEMAFGERDCLIVISNSGTTAAPIEVALAAH